MPDKSPEQYVAEYVNSVTDSILNAAEVAATRGVPKQLFISGVIFAVAQIGHECGIPTVKIGMALAEARQKIDNLATVSGRPN